jgi:hypothetical protein
MDHQNLQNGTIEVIVTMDDSRTDGDKGIFGWSGSPTVAAVPIDSLRENLSGTIEALKHIFVSLPDLGPGLSFDKVELSFEVTATGKVALLGTSAEVAGKGAIAITFKRRSAE